MPYNSRADILIILQRDALIDYRIYNAPSVRDPVSGDILKSNTQSDIDILSIKVAALDGSVDENGNTTYVDIIKLLPPEVFPELKEQILEQEAYHEEFGPKH